MALVLPRFVAIDSSILASWARDAFAKDPELRAFARDVQTSLLSTNWTPIICLQHFIELARHSDIKIAATRVNFLKSFQQIAWLGSSYGPNVLGAQVDVFEAEIKAILTSPNADFHDICQSVQVDLMQYGQPNQIEFLNNWRHLHPALQSTAIHEQEISSIAHTSHSSYADTKISRLKKIPPKDQASLSRLLPVKMKTLTKDLTGRGDPRLIDPSHTAQRFLNMISPHLADALNFEGTAYDVFVASQDVPRNDISEETTLRQFTKIARRRKLTKAAVTQLGIDLDQAWPKIRDAKIPSEIVKETLRKARKTAPRASGSDLGDEDLACLAPYVDAIIVDKRTHEFMTQGARRDPYFREMVGFFEKATSYRQLPEILNRYPVGGQLKE